MSISTRILVSALTLLTALAGAVTLLLVWPTGGPLRREGDPGGKPWLEETRRGARLDARIAAARRQIPAKRRVMVDLLARRLTLLEAAARFRELDLSVWEDPENYAAHLRAQHQGSSEGERLCRRVIDYVRKNGPGPRRGEAAARRLEAALEAHLACHDTVCLPHGPGEGRRHQSRGTSGNSTPAGSADDGSLG